MTPVNNPNQRAPSLEAFEKGINSLADIIAPSSVEIDFNFIRV